MNHYRIISLATAILTTLLAPTLHAQLLTEAGDFVARAPVLIGSENMTSFEVHGKCIIGPPVVLRFSFYAQQPDRVAIYLSFEKDGVPFAAGNQDMFMLMYDLLENQLVVDNAGVWFRIFASKVDHRRVYHFDYGSSEEGFSSFVDVRSLFSGLPYVQDDLEKYPIWNITTNFPLEEESNSPVLKEGPGEHLHFLSQKGVVREKKDEYEVEIRAMVNDSSLVHPFLNVAIWQASRQFLLIDDIRINQPIDPDLFTFPLERLLDAGFKIGRPQDYFEGIDRSNAEERYLRYITAVMLRLIMRSDDETQLKKSRKAAKKMKLDWEELLLRDTAASTALLRAFDYR